MTSPVPERLQLKDAVPSIYEEVKISEDFTYLKSLKSCDPRVKLFCDRTYSLSLTTRGIIRELTRIRSLVAGIIRQVPSDGSIDALSCLLGIIAELSHMIKWNQVTYPACRSDFRLGAKAILQLIPEMKKVTKQILKKASKVRDSVENFFPHIDETHLHKVTLPLFGDPVVNTDRQLVHQPTAGILLTWHRRKPLNTEGHLEAEVYGLHTGVTKLCLDRISEETQLRFLRYILNYTRTIVENSITTLNKTMAFLNKEDTVKQQNYCNTMHKKNFSTSDVSSISKSKSQFYNEMMQIVDIAAVLNYQFEVLKPFCKHLKHARNNRDKLGKIPTNFIQANIRIEDNRLIKYCELMKPFEISEPNLITQERTEDIVRSFGDLGTFITGSFNKMEKLVFLIIITEKDIFYPVSDESCKTQYRVYNKNKLKLSNMIDKIVLELKPFKQFLTKVNTKFQSQEISRHTIPLQQSGDSFLEICRSNPNSLWSTENILGETVSDWIRLTGDFQVTFEKDIFLIKSPSLNLFTYTELTIMQKLNLIYKLVENLQTVVMYSKYDLETALRRLKYTHKLIKKLSEQDRRGESVKQVIAQSVKQFQLLMDVMTALENFRTKLHFHRYTIFINR